MLTAEYEGRAINFPEQKVYWDNRIKELDEALLPLLKAKEGKNADEDTIR